MIRSLSVSFALLLASFSLLPSALADNKGGDKNKKPPAGAPASSAAKPEDNTPTLEIEPDNSGNPPAGNNPAGNNPPTLDTSGVPTISPDTGSTETGKGQEKDLTLGEKHVSWQDIVVVIRKPFLKAERFELIPSWGLTLNDNMIRHFMFNGTISYWLTDVLAVSAEGQLFGHEFLEPYDLVARDYRRLPTLNQYNWGAAFDFNYVPIYAKFAMFNKKIVHWEMMATLGVGVTQTQVLPRDPALPGWKNTDITPNVGLTARVFMSSWLTLDLGVRDYIFVDKFESVNRMATDTLEMAKANADSRLINHIVASVGLSFWFPMTFHYTTFR